MNSSSLMLRRFLCFNASPPSSSSSILCFSSNRNRKLLVFLGSPQVSATVLNALLNASGAPDSLFEVAAIVTQPPSRKNRGKKVLPSPLAQHALDRGFPSDLIFTPARAGEIYVSANSTSSPSCKKGLEVFEGNYELWNLL